MDSADDPGRGVVLESSKETYLITRSMHEGKTRYALSVLGPHERLVDTPSPNVSRPCPSTSSIPPPDAASKMQVIPHPSSLPEPPSEERKTSTDDPPPLSGATTDPPEPGTSQDSKSEGKETDASSKPPSIPCPPATLKPTVRILRPNLSDEDFTFENDIIIIKGGAEHHMDDGKMVVDGDGNGEGDVLKMRVLRWRWYLRS